MFPKESTWMHRNSSKLNIYDIDIYWAMQSFGTLSDSLKVHL